MNPFAVWGELYRLAAEFMSKHGLWALALVILIIWLAFIGSRSEVESWTRYCADHGSKDPYCAVKMMNAERNSVE